MEQKKTERSYILDIVKGVAIVNIVYIHTVFWTGTQYIPFDLVRHLSLLIDVPLFFFLSGWAASLHQRTFASEFKRFWKLFIPFTIMLIFLTIFLLILYKRTVPIERMIGWITLSYRESYEFPVVMGSMWFLPPLILISFCTPLLQRIAQQKPISIFLIGALVLLIFAIPFINSGILNDPILNIVSIRVLIFYLFFYFFGMISKNISINLKQLLIGLLLTILFFIALSLITGAKLYLGAREFPPDAFFNLQLSKFPPNALYLLASLLFILVTLYLKNYEGLAKFFIHKLPFLKLLQYSGVHVFEICLYQGFGSTLIGFLVFHPLAQKVAWPLLLVVAFISNLLISYLLVFLFSRVNRRILSY